MNRFEHELIAASAGTGKTYQLTVRYLRLLFATGEPERIIALTFTRKAAGEFFEKIFHRLACAAADPTEASALAKDLGIRVDCTDCLGRLRLLLDRLHRLQLSTYDSFFSRVVQSFPFELGLGAPPELIDDHQRAEAVRRAEEELLAVEEGEEERLQEFWHAFKRATMGREEKRTTDLLDAFIEEHQSLYLEEPDPLRWGNPGAIWPKGCPWRDTGEDPLTLSAAFSEVLPWASLTPTQSTDWRTFLDELAGWHPPSDMPVAVRKFVVKFLEVLPDLDRRSAQITVRRKMVLSVELCELGARLARTGVWMELAPRLVATRGIQELVALFERIYRNEVRGRGWLTIEDMTRLLSGGGEGGGLGAPELRQQMNYRLDGAFDHWLLDEFQDTSHAQWRAIEGLIDEVLQDPEGRRSLFAVGDTKQCLYMWRGSDDKLFERVAGLYESALHQRKLSESYRSTAPVLAMVNGVFGASAAIAGICGEEVSARWGRMWTEHRCAARLAMVPGYACWLHSESEDEPRMRDLLRLIQGLAPLSRGLSVAVLTQTNAEAEAIVDYLRSEGAVSCSLAADVHPGRDNAASAALRSYLRVAAHPGDKLAWTHLRMSPLGEQLAFSHGDPAGLADHVRHTIHERGMQGAVTEWERLAAPHIPESNRFSRDRIAQCAAAARDFDARGGVDIDDFLRGLDALALRESDVPGQIAVMTIHKAKGLDWDLVILPDLEGKSLRERRGGLAVKRSPHGAVEWILQAPRKDIASCDTVLGKQIDEVERDAAFEQLCVLYVGMTRARLGLIAFTSDPSRTKSANFVTLLAQSLGAQPRDRILGGQTFTCLWEHGDPRTLETALPSRAAVPAASWRLSELPEAQHARAPRISAVRPSDDAETPTRRPLWRPDAGALLFGVSVHAALARIEWLPGDAKARGDALGGLLAGCEDSVRSAVLRIVARAPEVFTRPAGSVELWRERAFEVMTGTSWISGQFDRVILHRDAAGRAVSAQLVDFKSGAGTSPTRYSRQMELYRAALSTLVNLPTGAVELRLLAPA